ncbi:MAG: aldo/keto reductase, partial [Pseudomonadota bacterium]
MTLGDGVLSVSAIAFGCWRFLGDEPPQARAKIDAVGEAGLNFLDTADIYGFGTPGGFGAAETQLGAVFKDAPHLRDQFVVATKGGVALPKPYDASFDYLVG